MTPPANPPKPPPPTPPRPAPATPRPPSGPGRLVNADTIWGKRPLVEVSRTFSVADGRYGYEPAVQGVAMGNLNPARRGRGGK